jgi:hypothetical protein
MKRLAYLIAFSSLLLMACSDGVPLEPAASSSESSTLNGVPRAVTRPFLAHYETSFSNLIPPDPTQTPPFPGSIDIHGIGFGTHIGASTFDTVQPLLPLIHFESTLNAANGDELYLLAIGDPPTDPPGTDPFSFSGSFEFTGGTGRFAGATGSATFQGTASLGTMTGQVTYIGHITF